MALEDLTPAVRVESILNGDEITPANRLEYFLQKAATELPKVAAADAGKVLAVNASGEWAADNKSGLCVETEGILNKSYNDLVAMLTNGIFPFIFREEYVYFLDSIFVDGSYGATFKCVGNDGSRTYVNASASGLFVLDSANP